MYNFDIDNFRKERFVQFKINDFYQYMGRIVLWNSICANPTSTSEQQYQTQIAVTAEEVKEALNGYLNNDRQEYVDGICDVVVTAGYLAYINGNTNLDVENKDFPVEVNIVNFEKIVRETPEKVNYNMVFWIFLQAMETIDPEYLHAYMISVLDSNDSKILKFSYPYEVVALYEEVQQELAYVRNAYGKDFNNIVPVRFNNDLEEDQYYVFRANNGVGKILKPSTFRHPTDFNSHL